MQVYLIGLAEEQSATGRASKYDSYALDKMSIRVSPKVFGARIRCAQLIKHSSWNASPILALTTATRRCYPHQWTRAC